MAGLGEIAVGTVLHGVGVTVAKLIFHGVVAGLGAFVRLEGTLPPVGIIVKMIADTFRHCRPFEVRAAIRNDYRLGYAERSLRAMQVIAIVTIGKFNSRLTRE